jgi:hypothetical protein
MDGSAWGWGGGALGAWGFGDCRLISIANEGRAVWDAVSVRIGRQKKPVDPRAPVASS